MVKQTLFDQLKQHFGGDPSKLPVVQEELQFYERPNLQLAIEKILQADDCEFELSGIVEFDTEATMARMASKNAQKDFDTGPVEYIDVQLARQEKLACVKQGWYLFRQNDVPGVIFLSNAKYTYPPKLRVEVMAPTKPRALEFMRQITAATNQGKAYKGHVLSLEIGCDRAMEVKFHRLPNIGRDEIILPAEILQRLERHTVEFAQHSERLKQAGRHIKRGILLHGQPGTGKTLSAMYLASRMPQRTVLLMTGAAMGSMEVVCNLARMLQPSTVVLEDVDLIGTTREHQAIDANALLFEMLNQMDGLSEDCDVLFVLTTNRPDILEPALASRPGRIDQAIEIPLPDAECRLRLLELYGKGLILELSDRTQLVQRTAGASAAFLRELLRRAAVFSAIEENTGPITVRDQHMDQALTELLVGGGQLTKSLLGASATGQQE